MVCIQEQFGDELVRLLPKMRKFALVLTRSPDLADDLVHDALEKALKFRHLFRPETHLDRWLIRIIHNTWIDQCRRKARARSEAIQPSALDQVSQEQFDPMALPSRIDLAKICTCLDQIPERYSFPLKLVALEGLAYRDVAHRLKLPIGTVMSRIHKARIMLRQLLLPPLLPATA